MGKNAITVAVKPRYVMQADGAAKAEVYDDDHHLQDTRLASLDFD